MMTVSSFSSSLYVLFWQYCAVYIYSSYPWTTNLTRSQYIVSRRKEGPITKIYNQKINFRNPTDYQPRPDTNLSKLKLCCNFFCCLDSNFSRKIIVFGIHNFEAQTIFWFVSWNSIWKHPESSLRYPPRQRH